MSVSSLTSFVRRVSDAKNELQEVGHFTALNLNYDSSSYEAKRNAEQLSKELSLEIQSYEEMFENDDNEDNSFKSELDSKRKLLQKIQNAVKILTNEDLRSHYLHEIKVRSYLSQAFTFGELRERFCRILFYFLVYNKNEIAGRVFPFFMFEVNRKNGGLFQDGHHRFLCLNFIEMIVEERKDNQLVKGFNCSSIKQIMPGFNMDELYLSIDNGDGLQTHHYQIKYWQQRDLLIELILFSKYAERKRTAMKSERMENPNISLKDFDKSSDDIFSGFLEANLDSASLAKSLRMLSNDSVIPQKHLFQCQVYKKRSMFDKKTWMTIGTSNIILSDDKAMKSIIQILPITKNSTSFVKISDKGDFGIIINEHKNYFHACKAADAESILKLGAEIVKGIHEHAQVISTFPYNKKDSNVSKILSKKLAQINQKISETKILLTTLRSQREEIKAVMAKEKVKTRPETIYSTESKSTLFSKTSINDENFLKSQMSLFTLDEKDESSDYPSLTSLAIMSSRRDKRALTETTDLFYSKKDRDLNETLNSLDADFIQPVKERKPAKSIDNNAKKPILRQNSRTLSAKPEIRKLARFMSARFQDPTERAPAVKPMPMSLKDVGDDNANNSPNFPSLNPFDEGDYSQDKEKSSEGMANINGNGSEYEKGERKRQKFDV